MRTLLFITCASGVLLSACTLAPKLEVAGPALPTAYENAQAIDADNAASLHWRTVFADPRLQRYIEAALENNHDLRTALLNVEIARAQYGIQSAQLLPSLDAAASFTRQRAASAQTGQAETANAATANLSVPAYELDLFGRVRSMSQASFQRYLASSAGAQSARVTLISAVVEAYLAESLAQAQLGLAEATLNDWRTSYNLTKSLYDAAQASRLELVQSEGLVKQAQADYEGRQRDVMQARNALWLIVGGAEPKDMPEGVPFTRLPISVELPVGAPADLLINRPDIIQAEYELRAANADIGAARAAFFPQISIGGTYGASGTEFDNLFTGANRTWSFAPQITVPLFRGGALKGELRLSQLRKSVAVVAYEKTIATAYREVSDGLAGRATYRRQIAAQTDAVLVSALRLMLSRQRYQAGLDSRLEWLDAQRSDYTARQALNDLKYREYLAATALYKSLGGGSALNRMSASQG